MKDKLLQIINRYGIEHQQRKLEEEVFELQQAITIFENYDFGELEDRKNMFTKDITEEIADVMVMLKQFQYDYDIKDEDIEEIMNFKIDRQLERIENEAN